MVKIYPEQLTGQLNSGLRRSYLMVGNDPLLHHESQQIILNAARKQGFDELQRVVIDNHTDWDELFTSCQALSLFSARQVILLQLPDNGPTAAQTSQLATLTSLLHEDLLLLIQAAKLTKTHENAVWFKAISPQAAQVICNTPDHQQLPRWVKQRCQQLSISIDNPGIQLLCYCYEGNLLALAQAIERLALLWPSGEITLPRVQQAVNDAAIFSPYHWGDALLAGKSKRALHILTQLQHEGCEPVVLLRTLQRELMLLLQLNAQPANEWRKILDSLRVWQNRRPLYTEALQRLKRSQLTQAIRQLTKLEIALKQDFATDVWPSLAALSLSLCQPHSFLEL